MSRRPARPADLSVGAEVWTSRTGPIARTVTYLEGNEHQETHGPLVHARRSSVPDGPATVFAVSELWVRA